MFYHSLASDWNHGNAHFLRGVAAELLARGHTVRVYEPSDGWSVQNLIAIHGMKAVDDFYDADPRLRGVGVAYHPDRLDLDAVLRGADLVLVHEWNDPELVAAIGAHRARTSGYRLLFHDTHHRSVSDPDGIGRYDLSGYDGVLAFGNVVRDLYLENGWADAAWTWHEAADTRVFYPRAPQDDEPPEGDLVWIGNWGDDERTAELREFLVEPIRKLGLKARVYGVRYPDEARRELEEAGIDYRGWLPNYRVPEVFGRFRLTVHVPRRQYVETLPGIPTIRPFEAMACGIPLISAPWEDSEGLFEPGEDFLTAQDGAEMTAHIDRLLAAPERAAAMADRARRTILDRHTCAHRVDELLSICHELGTFSGEPAASGPAVQGSGELVVDE